MYKPLEETKNLKRGQLVVCKCPDWNEEGFQIAVWNGREFEYSGQQNDWFNEYVEEFAKLNDDGIMF